eukprot:1137045-Pelagomonas_calceolata.AAC.2
MSCILRHSVVCAGRKVLQVERPEQRQRRSATSADALAQVDTNTHTDRYEQVTGYRSIEVPSQNEQLLAYTLATWTQTRMHTRALTHACVKEVIPTAAGSLGWQAAKHNCLVHGLPEPPSTESIPHSPAGPIKRARGSSASKPFQKNQQALHSQLPSWKGVSNSGCEPRTPVQLMLEVPVRMNRVSWVTQHNAIPARMFSCTQHTLHHELVDVEEFEDIKSGYKITLQFDQNPFFPESRLVKLIKVGRLVLSFGRGDTQVWGCAREV